MHRNRPPQEELPPIRLEELRARVRADYYDRPEVLASVAGRLFLSGDLSGHAFPSGDPDFREE